MADRKEEAEKLFREIYTVSVVPSCKKEEFRKDTCRFFSRHKDSKGLYTLFKAEILSKFVVQVPLNLKQLQERNFQPVEWWVRGLELESALGEQNRKRLVRWCRDIYFADFDYDRDKGLIVTSERITPMDAAII
jgi:CRISPR-associated endonuclease/helicase Cas3